MLCLVAAALAPAPTAWYGPVTVSDSISYTGNPYDPAQNDVEVEFSGHGLKLRRLAYFTSDGKFAATLVAPQAGSYTATFVRNGSAVHRLKNPVAVAGKLPHGFIEIRGRRFQWSDGAPFFPIGYDYGWKAGKDTVAQGITKMGLEGANWSRVWACPWDGKNPWWPAKGEKLPLGELLQGPLATWDGIVSAAEQAGVHFQFVLFHHGEFSSTTDSNWKENPWNSANGGFLGDPTDFFSNPEAKRLTKIWLRYAVARYAASPSVFAWELFNEVQWTDAVKKNPGRVGDVAAWHKEMAAYVRSIDPYHHPVTSSSSESLDSGVFDAMDYMQPHTYPENVLASIAGFRFTGKPGFFGEFGPPFGDRANYRTHVRDGIYGGMLAGHAGCGMFWSWDQIDSSGLAASYRAARRVVDESGLTSHLGAQPIELGVSTPSHGDLVLAPAGGWEKSTTTELDAGKIDFAALRGWSPYFQSLDGSHKEWASPLTIHFNASGAAGAQIKIGDVSGQDRLDVFVNGRLFSQTPLSSGNKQSVITADFPAGPVTLRLENHGADWIHLDSITLPGLGATATAHGMGDRHWALIRVFGPNTSDVSVTGLGLSDGTYRAIVFNADTAHRAVQNEVSVKNGAAELRDLPGDCVIDLAGR